jgi:hypothetical protein
MLVAGTVWRSMQALGRGCAVGRLFVDTEGRWWVGFRPAPGVLVPAAPLRCWCLPRAAAGLQLRVAGTGPVDLLLFRGRLGAVAWRRLTVQLRLGRPAAQGAGGADFRPRRPDRPHFT